MNSRIKDIEQWIIKGDHDYGTAKITYLHIPEYLDTITFHCQQAVEKYLKAYLIFISIDFKYTHDLIYLLELITQKDSDFNSFFSKVSELQGYAVEVRYPDETVYLSDDVVVKAMKTVKIIREIVTDKINLSINHNLIIDD
jgi:HEPN domain-containing protein